MTLDGDVMTVPDQDILGTGVLATYIGGRLVYENEKGRENGKTGNGGEG